MHGMTEPIWLCLYSNWATSSVWHGSPGSFCSLMTYIVMHETLVHQFQLSVQAGRFPSRRASALHTSSLSCRHFAHATASVHGFEDFGDGTGGIVCLGDGERSGR